VSGTSVSNFITTVILGPFAGAVFGAMLSGTFVVKARPTDPRTKVRTEPPTIIIRSILVLTGTQNSKTSKDDDAWMFLVGGLMLLVLGVFLYARYALMLWSVIQTCGAVCVGLAVPIMSIAAANRGDLRQAAAWWTLTGGSVAIGAIGALFAPGFALSRTPEWLLKAAAAAPGAGVPSILNLPKAFDFVSHLPNPQLDVLWLGLQAMGAVALCVALCLQVIRLAVVLVGGAGDHPPAFLRKLTVSSTAAHYMSVGLLIVLFYLCTSGKLYAAIHTKSWWYLWHYWPS
jgi:hypothetical protein